MATLIAFDVDGTLIDLEDKPRHEVIDVLDALAALPSVDVIVWSGGGKDYAEMWGRRLELPANVMYFPKTNHLRVDIAFDDAPEFNMADKVIIV